MTTDAAPATVADYGAWNPGIQSDVPWPLLPLSTIFRPENVLTGIDHVHELSDVAGLDVDDLVVFRPERLVVHELLIRVTADFSVPDGPRQEDLGIEFRRMVRTILTRHVEPHMPEIVAAYAALRRALAEVIDAELSRALAALSDTGAARAPRSGAGGILGLFRRAERPAARAESDWDREERIVRDWSAQAQSDQDPLRRAAYRALARVASAVRARHGRMWGDASLLAPIAVGLACNDHGAEVDRHAHRAAHPRRGAGRRLSPAAGPGAAGRHEHERRVRLGQEHDAAAAAPPRGRARRGMERLRRRQPGHLAQVPARLRRARRRVQVRRVRSPPTSWRSSTRSSTATWRARPSAAACPIS